MAVTHVKYRKALTVAHLEPWQVTELFGWTDWYVYAARRMRVRRVAYAIHYWSTRREGEPFAPNGYDPDCLPREGEVWKRHPVYKVEVSNQGRVRSVYGKYCVRPRVLGQRMLWSGYLIAHVRDKKPSRWSMVHRLVLETFVGTDTERPWVNHKNAIRHDNRLENLEWVTAAENSDHRFRVTEASKPRDVSQWPEPHVVYEVVRLFVDGYRFREIAERMGISEGLVRRYKSWHVWTGPLAEGIYGKKVAAQLRDAAMSRRSRAGNRRYKATATFTPNPRARRNRGPSY